MDIAKPLQSLQQEDPDAKNRFYMGNDSPSDMHQDFLMDTGSIIQKPEPSPQKADTAEQAEDQKDCYPYGSS